MPSPRLAQLLPRRLVGRGVGCLAQGFCGSDSFDLASLAAALRLVCLRQFQGGECLLLFRSQLPDVVSLVQSQQDGNDDSAGQHEQPEQTSSGQRRLARPGTSKLECGPRGPRGAAAIGSPAR